MFLSTLLRNWLVLLLLFLLYGCSAQNDSLSQLDSQTLANTWMTAPSAYSRNNIIKSLERRNDVEGLTLCLQNALHIHKSVEFNPVPRFLVSPKDVVEIIDALGRLKDPASIDEIKKASMVQDDQVYLAILDALKGMEGVKKCDIAVDYLKYLKADIQLNALDVLQGCPGDVYAEPVRSALFSKSELVRWRATHILGKAGDTASVGKMSLLLSDTDKSVRQAAEHNLKKLGVDDNTLEEWKSKATDISIDQAYSTQLAYQRAITDKDELQKELNENNKLMGELEDVILNYETKVKGKDRLVATLYEKERQLVDKENQLNIAAQQGESYRKQLVQLDSRLKKLKQEISSSGESENINEMQIQLNRMLAEKNRIENEAIDIKAKEEKFHSEILRLNNVVQQTQTEAKRAQKELGKMKDRESFLNKELEHLRKQLEKQKEPILVVSGPGTGTDVSSPSIVLNIIAIDDNGIAKLLIHINNREIAIKDARKKAENDRGIQVQQKGAEKEIYISQRLNLDPGVNTIDVKAVNINGIVTGKSITITRTIDTGKIFAAVIGINHYQDARDLKYAVNDARGFKHYLTNKLKINPKQVFMLTDEQATKDSVQNLLGTRIKRMAAKEDTVLIFFAGHGAIETDPSNPDGDGFEKYLLTHDSDLNDLYTTSLSMDEITKIFQRIRAERVIFIADTCYSGASGGRTILSTKNRATISELFFDRLTEAKGRIIMASSSANEVSIEDDTFQHGIFTYFLLEGLNGPADFDNDGLISVDEIFAYLSRKVPEASGQDQHPVKKGTSEGLLVLGQVSG